MMAESGTKALDVKMATVSSIIVPRQQREK
jgi:hypothetical protein